VIALRHHERFDGSGYPDGLVGTQIPIEARIVGAAGVFEALISRRPAKGPWRWLGESIVLMPQLLKDDAEAARGEARDQPLRSAGYWRNLWALQGPIGGLPVEGHHRARTAGRPLELGAPPEWSARHRGDRRANDPASTKA